MMRITHQSPEKQTHLPEPLQQKAESFTVTYAFYWLQNHHCFHPE